MLILCCVGESNFLQRAIESGETQLGTPNLACARLTSSTTEIVNHDQIEYPGAPSELYILAFPSYLSTALCPTPFFINSPGASLSLLIDRPLTFPTYLLPSFLLPLTYLQPSTLPYTYLQPSVLRLTYVLPHYSLHSWCIEPCIPLLTYLQACIPFHTYLQPN